MFSSCERTGQGKVVVKYTQAVGKGFFKDMDVAVIVFRWFL